MNQLFALFVTLTVSLCIAPIRLSAETPSRGIQFLPFDSLSTFQKSAGTNGETIFTSPELRPIVQGNEIIVSWNADMPKDGFLRIDIRAFNGGHATKWYCMGLWSGDPERHPRESVKRQKDDDGNVDTDTLILNKPAERVQLRLSLGADGKEQPKLKFLTVSLLDTSITNSPLAANQKAWGKTIEVPERSQMWYENGGVLCSPTTVSMILSYWSRELKQPSLDHDVPEAVKGIFDPNWRGTGNWVFNTAYAGSLPGMRAYTTRLSDVSELEDLVAQGVPVGLSICYNRLRGKSRTPSGHLVVCVGFTDKGDVIINDPGTSKNVRKTFPRANLIDAWAYSKNTVYLIYPEKTTLPEDRFAHWDSTVTKKNASSAKN